MDTVPVSVRLAEHPKTPRERFKWLAPDRTWTYSEEEALVLNLRRRPRMRDVSLIQSRCHEFAGGLQRWLDIDQTERDLWQILRDRIIARLWPKDPEADAESGGRPEPQNDEEEKAQSGLIDAAFLVDDSDHANAYREIYRTTARIRFLAAYVGLVVDPPPGWEDLGECPDEPQGIVDMLRLAYEDAVLTSEEARGN